MASEKAENGKPLRWLTFGFDDETREDFPAPLLFADEPLSASFACVFLHSLRRGRMSL